MSMDSLHVRRLTARYQVPRSDPGVAARLDRLLAEVLERALEPALAALGLPPHEVVCIRKVAAPVAIDLSGTDPAIVERWVAGLVAGVRSAIESGRDVIRFSSRQAALADLLLCAARGDTSRAWAYRQAELVTEAGAGPGDLAMEALLASPDAAPAALRAVAQRWELRSLVARLPAGALEAIARAALVARRLETAVVNAPALGPALATGSPAAGAVELGAAEEARLATLARAPFVISAVAEASRADGADGVALVVLAVLAEDPGVLSAGPPVARAFVARLRTRALPLAAAPGRDDGSLPLRKDRPQPPPQLAKPPFRGLDETRPEDRGEAAEEAPAEREEGRPEDLQSLGRTRAGGLLYLLNLLEPTGIAAELAALDGPLRARSARFVLHAVALALIPIEPRDPAALAFSGLAPDSEPPDDDAPALTEEEREAIAAHADRLTETLCERVGREGESASALLTRVCRRAAEIAADPGWIEVRLSLDDVDTELRRAGLDLDPGWLPCLGSVVRFVYV